MDLTVERHDNVLSVGVKGRLDWSNSEAFRDALGDTIEDTDRAVIMDFGELDFIGSSGLRVILVTARLLVERDATLLLCGLSDPVREVFRITGFERLLPIHETLAEARASLGA